MPFHYSVHQRVVESDCELPFLAAVDRQTPDMTLRLRERAIAPDATPWYRTDSITIDRSDAGELVVRFADATAFLIARDGRSIAMISAPAAYTTGDLAAYVLGPILGIVLHLQGSVLLHAAAVVMRGKAIVIAGNAGSGKSTTAAMLHRGGYAVISDDLTEVVDGDVVPSLPSIRLWPDVVDALYGASAALPDRAPSWSKKIVRVESNGARHDIGAVLFLDRREDVPRLEPLPPRAAWQRLIASVYTVRLPGEAMSRRIFEVTAALANRVAMFAFHPPPLAASNDLGAFLERAL